MFKTSESPHSFKYGINTLLVLNRRITLLRGKTREIKNEQRKTNFTDYSDEPFLIWKFTYMSRNLL